MTTANDLVAAAKAQITEVSAEDLHQDMANTPIIIDVREPEEFKAGHIYGAINIPRGVLEFQVEGHPAVNKKVTPELQLKEAPIYVYCRTGGRSALAAESLKKLGFSQCRSVAGGILAWEAADYPLQNA